MIIQTITNIGFPIVACIYMYKMMNTTMKDNTDAINNLKNALDKHFKE